MKIEIGFLILVSHVLSLIVNHFYSLNFFIKSLTITVRLEKDIEKLLRRGKKRKQKYFRYCN